MSFSKKSPLKKAITILGGAIICIAVFYFSSCENFLDSGDTANQIKEAIEISNSNAITYYLIADKDSGTVIPASVSKRKKETFEIKFTPADDWEFIQWEAIDSTTEEPVYGAVSFADATKLETTATIIKPTENLQIHPKCVQLPKIVSVTPSSTELSYANTPIIITFNMPMEEESVTVENSVFKFGEQNISIKCSGQDMKDYFEAPVFNSNKTVLTIVPRVSKTKTSTPQLNWFIPDNSTAEINLSFGNEIKIVKDEMTFQLSQNSKNNFSVWYKNDLETTPPLKIQFFASRQNVSPENLDSNPADSRFNQEFIIGHLYDSDTYSPESDEYAAQFWQNRTNGSFYVYGQYKDESGVKSVQISCYKLNFDSTGHTYSTVLSKQETYTTASSGATFITENGATKFCVPFKVAEDINLEPVLIEVKAIDGCGNPSAVERLFAVVKNYIEGLDDYMQVYNYDTFPYHLPYDSNQKTFDLDYYNANLKKLRIYYYNSWEEAIEESGSSANFGVGGYPAECYTIECEYLDRLNNLRKDSFSAYDSENHRWTLDLQNVDSVEGLNLKITLTDDLGNSDVKEISYPANPVIQTVDKTSSQTTITFNTFDGSYCSGGLVGEDSSFIPFSVNKATITNEINYRIISLENFLFGQLSSVVYNKNTSRSSVQDLEFTGEPVYEKGADGNIDITVCIDETLWDSYSDIYIKCPHQYSGSSRDRTIFYNKTIKQTSLTFQRYSGSMYKENTTITLYGIQDGCKSAGKEYVIPKLTDAQYDNANPTGGWLYFSDYDNYKSTVTDKESGLKKVDVYYGTKLHDTYNLNGSSATISIPRWDVISYGKDGINVVTEDNNGNIGLYNRAYFIQQAPAFYANGKNATKLSLTTGEIEPLNSIWLSIFVSQFNSSNSSWTAYKYNNKESQGLYPTITDDPESGKKIYTIDINIPSEEKFLKIWHAYNSDLSVPCFYYNGTQNSGSYDFLLANGSSKESVVVSSDAPVFVYTLVTQNSYDEIKDWSREDWEWATKHIGDTQIDFNSSSRPVNYQIPVSQINRGEHYVVVVHYANGKATMSEIMQK